MELTDLSSVISISFEEALELALSLSSDGVLDEKIYNAIVEKLPPELQGDFTLALTTRGIVAIPSQVEPGETKNVADARNRILDEIEAAGYLCNSFYRRLFAGMNPRSQVSLNRWILENEIPVQGSYETDLKKKLKKKPNIRKAPTKWGPRF